jgi:hypothetical protein
MSQLLIADKVGHARGNAYGRRRRRYVLVAIDSARPLCIRFLGTGKPGRLMLDPSGIAKKGKERG